MRKNESRTWGEARPASGEGFALYHNNNKKVRLCQEALRLAALGLDVLPLKPRGKTPITAHGVKDATTSETQIIAWWRDNPSANVGVACNRVVVLDFDTTEGEAGALLAALEPLAWAVAKTGKGKHLYFGQPTPPLGNARGQLPHGVDVRGVGGYVVAPPSVHPNGARYEWVRAPEGEPTALPDWVRALLSPMQPSGGASAPVAVQTTALGNGRRARYVQAALAGGVDEVASAMPGTRNNTLNAVAYRLGRMVASGDLAEREVFDALVRAGVQAGLGEREAMRTAQSGLRAGLANPWDGLPEAASVHTSMAGVATEDTETTEGAEVLEKLPTRDKLAWLARQAFRFVRDTDGEVYAVMQTNDRKEVWPAKSRKARATLARMYEDRFGTMPTRAAIDETLELLADATEDVETVHVRVARLGDTVVVDLGRDDWLAIEIDALGWTLTEKPRCLFKRSATTEAMPLPEDAPSTEALAILQSLIPNTSQHGLLLAWMVNTLLGVAPFPVLVFTGEQGSAKSTTTEAIKRLLDPNAANLRMLRHDANDVLVSANAQYVLAFDNVSRIYPSISDLLCILSTGGGFSKRRLYSDYEEATIKAQRPIILNGIGDIVHRPDLLDRAVVVEMQPFVGRVAAREYWRRFEAIAPRLLGALCNLASEVLACLGEAAAMLAERVDETPRMADFAEVCQAVEMVLGIEVVDAYLGNRAAAIETLLEGNMFIAALLGYLNEVGTIQMSAADLLMRLNAKYTQRPPEWPQSADHLAKTLTRYAPALRGVGVNVQRLRVRHGSAHRRVWRIEKQQ